jgi:hypothetical protein
MQSVSELALGKLGIVGAGETPEAADLSLAVQSLKSYYQKLINAGAFGALIDVIPSTTDYEAGENERIVHDGSVTVTLPVQLPLQYQSSDYGWVSYSTDIGLVRPPRDLSVISIVDTESGDIEDYLYDNRLRSWIDVNSLVAGDTAPLSHRDENGLACALALRIADSFGQQSTESMARAATRFEEALCNQWSVSGGLVQNPDYF